MFQTRTLAALLGLSAGLAACHDTSTDPLTGPVLAEAGEASEPRAALARWAPTRLSNERGTATDVNNQGQVVGYAETSGGTRAFVWSNGTMRFLGTLGGNSSRADAINEKGQVVGDSYAPNGLSHAFLWENGIMRDLGTLGADASSASAIDGNGRVVGDTQVLEGPILAFVWENGRMRRLAGLENGYSTATGIDNLGRIVGRYGSLNSLRAFRWVGGTLTDLGTLGGPTAEATDIVGGRIVGQAATANGAERAFLWVNGMMTGLGTLAGGNSAARGINALGHIVGWSAQEDSLSRAVLWKDGVISSVGVGSAANSNKSDWIVGTWSIGGSFYPVLWRLTTEPPPPAGAITVGPSFFLSERNQSVDPAVDTVRVGTKVTWAWISGTAGRHSVQSIGTPGFSSSAIIGGAGAKYSFTFTKAGTYRFNCVRHPTGMTGRVVVN